MVLPKLIKASKDLPSEVPSLFQKYFWDSGEFKIKLKNSRYVINRLLDKGDLSAIKWVLKNFPKDLIIKTVKTRRDWQKKSANFWAVYFNLDGEDIKCLNKSYLNQRKEFWPY